jgi:3D (Asp-Asp-Asp) domain-containing protein
LSRKVSGMVVATLLATVLWQGTALAFPDSYPIEDGYYFGQTGHTVTGKFWEFYRQKGGLQVFGYPISEPFQERGVTVQYFERVRMELIVPPQGDPFVRLANLGQQLTGSRQFKPLPSSTDTPDCSYFPVTGHYLAHGFKKFWDQMGGLEIFGMPISEEITENGRVVQYFERARFEYHPEDSYYPIQLGLLGREYAEMKGLQFDPLPEPPKPLGFRVLAKITGYTTHEVNGNTATGTRPRWGTVAVDPSYIPLGSRLLIDGFDDTVFTAEDTGGAVKGWVVDVWVGDNLSMAYQITGYRWITVWLPDN